MITIRLLGELEVLRDGVRVALPPSRKTRALLAYLVASGREQRRDRLCSMFWEMPDDPRGALRWSLSRLRAVVDADGDRRIAATRDMVGFVPAGAAIDLARLKTVARDLAGLDTNALADLAGTIRGEFLEGIDLPDLHDFQAWCLAEREDVRRMEVKLLTVLGERLAADPEAALPHARHLVRIDPFNAEARSLLVRHLVALGRRAEAEEHMEAGTRLLREAGEGGEHRLLRTWRALSAPPLAAAPAAAPGTAVGAATVASAPAAPGLVGRASEMAELEGLLAEALAGSTVRVALVTADPGIGKSRLAGALADRAAARGIAVHAGRAREAGQGSPYAIWRDLLGGLPVPAVAAAATADLPEEVQREQMFADVARRLLGDAARPAVLVLDDVQWCDEASADLLHYVLRTARSPLLVILAARSGELPDNRGMLRLLRSLRQDRLLAEIDLAPMADDAIRALVLASAPEADAGRIAAEAEGNALFAIELARQSQADAGAVPRPLKEIIRDRIDRLPGSAAEILRLASVLGPSFTVDRLWQCADGEIGELTQALAAAERHALVQPAAGRDGAGYAFAHDLIHRAIYTGMPEPRRRLMHLKVARTLAGSGVGLETLADEIVRHAVLGGDDGLAAEASVEAGRRSLRLHAHAEAAGFARRGLRHAGALAEPARIMRLVELTEIEFRARRPQDVAAAIVRLEALAEAALDQGCRDHAWTVYQLLSALRWEHGLWREAKRDTLRAELASRTGDERRRVVAMAETARCLAMLERDLPEADALLLEAGGLGRRLGIEPNALADASGLLRLQRGEIAAAAELFERARMIARNDGERLSEFFALEHLAELELLRRNHAAALALADEMAALAEKLAAGSEAPFARSLQALCRLALGEPLAEGALAGALADLRDADAKRRLALCLRLAAETDLAAGDPSRAAERAAESLRLSEVIDRPSDIALSRVLLAAAAGQAGDAAARARHLSDLAADLARPVSHEARMRAAAVTQAAAGTRRPRPMLVRKAG